MHHDFGKMENITSGTGWAVGYESDQIQMRAKAARHFDFRKVWKRILKAQSIDFR